MNKWYSVRMRSSIGGPHEDGGMHISGAERLIEEENIQKSAREMIHRATNHTRGKADFISLKIEAIQEDDIHYIPALRVKEVENKSPQTTKQVLREQVASLSIQPKTLISLYDCIIHEDVTRGAIIVDINSGKRLDPFVNRGVRVSHFDWDKQVNKNGLVKQQDVHHERRAEAIALASKVAAAGTILELCCSDDPEYTTGYLSCHHTFIRIPHMKKYNSPYGGRVFFIDPNNINLDDYIHYLEKTPVLIGGNY